VDNIVNQLKNIKLILLPGRKCPKEYKSYHNLAFNSWMDSWVHAYEKELGTTHEEVSDDFNKQDEILALFNGDECIGTVFFRALDLRFDSDRKDSYFDCWPEIAMKKLSKTGDKHLINSQFNINRNYRRMELGVDWMTVLATLSTKRFLCSTYDSMPCNCRRSKGIHTFSYQRGAIPMAKNLIYEETNDPIDLLTAVHGKTNLYLDDKIEIICEHLWSKLIAVESLEVVADSSAEQRKNLLAG
jgi:NAD(P)H-flavin reductase